MRIKSTICLIILILLCVRLSSSKKDQYKQYRQYLNDLIEKILVLILKSGAKIIANPKLLRTTIKVIVEKTFKVSLTKSALKKIPVVGILSGLAFGAWRTING